jgi:hypothetical protein
MPNGLCTILPVAVLCMAAQDRPVQIDRMAEYEALITQAARRLE